MTSSKKIFTNCKLERRLLHAFRKIVAISFIHFHNRITLSVYHQEYMYLCILFIKKCSNKKSIWQAQH